MDYTDAVVGGSDDALQQGTQAGLAGPASQTREEWEGETYSMKKENMMGRVIIFNNRKVHKIFQLAERTGSDKDAENMESLFSTMGFKVTIHTDTTKDEMVQILEKESKEDHSSNNCFVCIVLSHADGSNLYYCTDCLVHVDDLMSTVKGQKCPSLAGKPKLFFVQACLEDWENPDADHMDDETEPVYNMNKEFSVEADFFVFESLVRGSYAWNRDKNAGSWFIQAIYDVFSSSWKKKDVHSMCTKVIAKVAEHLEKGGHEDQPPCITNQLRKELNLFE